LLNQPERIISSDIPVGYTELQMKSGAATRGEFSKAIILLNNSKAAEILQVDLITLVFNR